jgi:hypothetical protein
MLPEDEVQMKRKIIWSLGASDWPDAHHGQIAAAIA